MAIWLIGVIAANKRVPVAESTKKMTHRPRSPDGWEFLFDLWRNPAYPSVDIFAGVNASAITEVL